jgi:hypothetical protein
MASERQESERPDKRPVILEGELPSYVRDAYRFIEVRHFTADGKADFLTRSYPFTLTRKIKKNEATALAERASDQAYEKIARSLTEYGKIIGADLIHVFDRQTRTTGPNVCREDYITFTEVESVWSGGLHSVLCENPAWRVSTQASLRINAAFWEKKDEQKEE